MAINFDKAFGIHEQALLLRSQRSELLANNLSNADTPNYKARDLDFKALLSQEGERLHSQGLEITDPRHIGSGGPLEANLLYRVPLQPSIDGNSVDTQIEQAEFMRNALGYQASLQFLSGRIKGLMSAIKGE